MNVDWNWIKQRPHFLAEYMEQYYDIRIVNQYRYSRKGYQNRDYKKNIYMLKVIPRIDRYNSLKWINIIIKKIKIKRLIDEYQPDYFYLTYPEQYKWLPENCSGKIVYDCMDDYYGLSRKVHQKKEIVKDELELCQNADFLIVSSKYLKATLSKRYGTAIIDRAEIVRNAFNGKIADISLPIKKQKNYIICYFGTISDWFDFDLIKRSLNEFDTIEYLLIGPLHRNVVIPNDNRIRYGGTVEHDKLGEIVGQVDCFIMPFILDESIKAVDPVKLYEYINFNRNIISIRYEEVERFSNFVLFYNNYEEYREIIKKLLHTNGLKYTQEMRKEFLMNNSWKTRAEAINRFLIKDNLGIGLRENEKS